HWASLSGADLSGAFLPEVDFSSADLCGANLRKADLSKAFLGWAFLRGTDLSGADLQAPALLGTDLTSADLTGCRVYGVSAWSLKLDSTTKQQNLIIGNNDEPTISVDNIEVAQFIYLMLHNHKVRDVIDAITSKTVLILGR